MIVRDHVRTEGLRPFSARIGVSVGCVRSLMGTRPALSSTIESVAHALGLHLSLESKRAGNQSVPGDIAEALQLTNGCTVADAVKAIRTLREPIDGIELARIVGEAQALLDRIQNGASQSATKP